MSGSAKRRLALSLALATTLAMSGCSSTASNDKSSTSDQQLTIGASVLGMQFPAVVALVNGMKAEAKELGVKVVVDDAAGQAAKQANDLNDLVAQKVDGIIVNAADSKAVVTPVDAALKANVPVASAFTTLGTATCAYPGSVAHAGFDEEGWAKIQGDNAVKLLPDGGEVAIIDGSAGLESSKIRHDGFVAQLKANPKIKVVASQPGNFDRPTARTAMENILQAHPNLSLVYAPDDNMAVGAIQAIKASGKTGIKVLGIGGSKDGLKAVKDGSMQSTVYSSLEEGGKEIMKAMVDSLRAKSKPAETCVKLPQTLVDSSNIDQFIDKGEY